MRECVRVHVVSFCCVACGILSSSISKGTNTPDEELLMFSHPCLLTHTHTYTHHRMLTRTQIQTHTRLHLARQGCMVEPRRRTHSNRNTRTHIHAETIHARRELSSRINTHTHTIAIYPFYTYGYTIGATHIYTCIAVK